MVGNSDCAEGQNGIDRRLVMGTSAKWLTYPIEQLVEPQKIGTGCLTERGKDMNTWPRVASLLHQFIGIAVIVVLLTAYTDGQQTTVNNQLDESLLDPTTREWLAEIRRLGIGSSPEAVRWREKETEFKAVLHACVNQLPGSKAVTVVGRIGVAGAKPVDPRSIASPCAILEGGIFATRIKEGVSSLPFRLQGHEPLDLPIQQDGTAVVNVGQVTLKPLPRKSIVTAVGQILLEDDPVIPRPPQVQVAWHIVAERLTKEVMSFEYETKFQFPPLVTPITQDELQLRSEKTRQHAFWSELTRQVMHFEYDRNPYLPPPVVTRATRDGRIRTTGLVPAFYQVVISAPGYITTSYYIDLTDKAGKTAELNPMSLLVAKSFTNSIGVEFVRIPPGEFPAKPYYDGEKAPALMTVAKEFYISKHEFSRGQYEKLTGTLAADFGVPQEKETNGHPLRFLIGKGKGAMELEPAFRICRIMSDLPAEKMAGRTYRLPEEHEWVHACRAGTITRLPVKYEELMEHLPKRSPTGPTMGGMRGSGFEAMGMPGNMFETSINNLRPVDEGRPNPWGLYKMLGNVREISLRWLSPEEAAQWALDSDSSTPEIDLENGWRLRVASWSGKGTSCLYKPSAALNDPPQVAEILVRGGGLMSTHLESVRARRLRGMDYGIGLRLVCTIAE